MVVAPVIATAGVRRLQADLRRGIPESAVLVRGIVKAALAPMLLVAHAQADKHRDTGELGASWSSRVRGAQGRLDNPLPQAKPLEFGGTIAPKGTPIKLPELNMIYGEGGAIREGKDETERLLRVGFEALARRINFH